MCCSIETQYALENINHVKEWMCLFLLLIFSGQVAWMRSEILVYTEKDSWKKFLCLHFTYNLFTSFFVYFFQTVGSSVLRLSALQVADQITSTIFNRNYFSVVWKFRKSKQRKYWRNQNMKKFSIKNFKLRLIFIFI